MIQYPGTRTAPGQYTCRWHAGEVCPCIVVTIVLFLLSELICRRSETAFKCDFKNIANYMLRPRSKAIMY